MTVINYECLKYTSASKTNLINNLYVFFEKYFSNKIEY